jgi:hypothetical protein
MWLPLESQWLDLSLKTDKRNMGITVATESLYAPVAHVALLKPCKALGSVSSSSN